MATDTKKKKPKKKSTAATGEDQGTIGQARHDVAGGYNALSNNINSMADLLLKGPPGDPSVAEETFGAKAAPKKAAAKKKAAAAPTDPSTPVANPFASLAAGLTSDMQAQQAPVEQAITGAQLPGLTQSATGQALSEAGLSPGSSAAQWLDSNIAQANANDAPMQAAMNAYGAAYQTGQQGVDTALSNLSQANALGIQAAPETTWLNDLATHIQSNLAYSGEIPTADLGTLPPALQYYLQQSGGAGGTGETSLSTLAVPGAKTNAPTLPAPQKAAGASTNGSVPTDVGTAPG